MLKMGQLCQQEEAGSPSSEQARSAWTCAVARKVGPQKLS